MKGNVTVIPTVRALLDANCHPDDRISVIDDTYSINLPSNLFWLCLSVSMSWVQTDIYICSSLYGMLLLGVSLWVQLCAFVSEELLTRLTSFARHWTALHKAVVDENEPLIKLLMEYGADVQLTWVLCNVTQCMLCLTDCVYTWDLSDSITNANMVHSSKGKKWRT